MTSLSGITPSGRLTLGNHLGALRRFTDPNGYYFVANLHAMTTKHDPRRLAALTRECATLMLAAGIPPGTVFVQSDVPAHAQLAYLLECTSYVGELSRMIQYKEKGKGRPMTRASLFTYPCLMAADILLYGSDRVPVGGDQDQHVELARDIAIRFNREYGETFVVPQLAKAVLATRIKDLSNPAAKMNKSDTDDAIGTIRLLDPPDVIRRQVMRAVTDSGQRGPARRGGQARGHQPARDPGRLHRRRSGRAGGVVLVVRRTEAGRRGRGTGRDRAAAEGVRAAGDRSGGDRRPAGAGPGPGDRGEPAAVRGGGPGDGPGRFGFGWVGVAGSAP